MYVTTVLVHVVAGKQDEFAAASATNAAASRDEPGNIRFDILQRADDPRRFLMYEAYEDEQAAKAHKETAHYLQWRAAVADWMAEPRQGIVYRSAASPA